MNQGGGNKRNRGGGGGGGGSQQRRRRSGGQGGGRQQQAPKMPSGPTMTALGESTYEAVFDHGNEGYGVWFDGAVREDPMYKQWWKGTGTRPLYVKIEENRIVLTKDLDRDLPIHQQLAEAEAQAQAETGNVGDADVDAAIEEAVAEALAAAEEAAAEGAEAGSGAGADAATGDKVYSPEEAAALFAQGELVADAPEAEAGEVAAPDAEAEADVVVKPKRRAPVKRRVTKKAAEPDE